MRDVALKDIPWIVRSADELMQWLIANSRGSEWSRENQDLPTAYRWTVSYITYDGLFTELWIEPWFQRGIRCFTLLALEREGTVRFCRCDTGQLLAVVPGGNVVELDDFLSGESLAIRHDPHYADLCWDPVDAAGHLLAEYASPEGRGGAQARE